MTKISARGVEWAEQFYQSHEDRRHPDGYREWGDDIMRVYTGHDAHDVRDDLVFKAPMRIVFAELSGDVKQEASLIDAYIRQFQNPACQEFFLLDGSAKLVQKDAPDFYRLYGSSNRHDTELMHERAVTYMKKQCNAIRPFCQNVFKAIGEAGIPTGGELRNLRLSIDTETGEMGVRGPNPFELLADMTIGKLRDARAGSLLNQNGQPLTTDEGMASHPFDRLVNWLVDQPALRPIITGIAENYSSLMKPDPDSNISINLTEWQQKRQQSPSRNQRKKL